MKNKSAGMSLIVKTTVRWIAWFILLDGFYLLLHGHLGLGGGFAGGLKIALAFIYLVLAYGKDYLSQRLNMEWVKRLMSGGVLAFLLIGWLGILVAGKFFVNFLAKGSLHQLLSGGTIPLINICIGLNIGILLSVGLYYLVEFRSQGR